MVPKVRGLNIGELRPGLPELVGIQNHDVDTGEVGASLGNPGIETLKIRHEFTGTNLFLTDQLTPTH